MNTGQPPAMVRRGTNLDPVVLDAIRRADQRLSRVELASATGLSGQAISNIIRRLLDAGLSALPKPVLPKSVPPPKPAARRSVPRRLVLHSSVLHSSVLTRE